LGFKKLKKGITMTDKHPYVISNGPFVQVINYLRKSFPSTFNSDTMKKLGYAPKNESYIISTLRFIGVIDEEGKTIDKASKIFSQHEDKAFQKEFSGLVKNAYNDLFSLHSEAAWKLDTNSLITFFRQSDKSTALVGKKQANTFKALAAMCGFGEVPEPKVTTIKQIKTEKPKARQRTKPIVPNLDGKDRKPGKEFGLTVRIEINLPAEGDQETYDRIFRSIRENLLNG
jgi:hypothetical protein